MANPFDQVVDVDDSPGIEKEEKKEGLEISFTLDRRMLERGIFIAIIAVLGFLVFLNPLCDNCAGPLEKKDLQPVTGNVVMEDDAEIEISSVEKEDNSSDETPEENQTQQEESEDTGKDTEENAEEMEEEGEEEEADLPFEGNFDFKLLVANCVRDEEDDRPVKIENIEVMMENNWRDFEPRIIVYWYDAFSSRPIREKERAVVELGEIEKGKKQTIKIKEFDSTFFDPQRDEETIKLELYNQETGELLETIHEVVE
ncbi:hypothetical protein GF323_00950 [Candidatus Woesearchaeota archaeon]|nr:hypothetical protein [Candidatus Woesearchaeota archaeon]